MEKENLPTNYEQNGVTLQNLQNQNNVQETSTWVEWGYWYFTHGKIVKNVYELSKVVSPQQTIRQIATHTVGPLARKIDNTIGSNNANVEFLGYNIPCSFSTFGALATETLAMTISPAQWVACKTVNLISNSLARELITKLDLRNRGGLGREVAAAIQIGTTLVGQKTLEEVEKIEIVTSTYKKVDSKLKNISKPIDTFVNKQISNGLEKLGVDTAQPLGLTKADIDRERKLLASEQKVAEIEEKIDQLKRQEEELQAEVAHQEKAAEQNNQDAIEIINKVRKYEEDCQERKTMHKYEKHRKYNKVWAKQISEEFANEFNVSEQQRIDIQDEIVRKLHNKKDQKSQNKAMEKVIVKHKTALQDKAKMQLDDVKRAQTSIQCKLEKAKQQYESEKSEFDNATNVYQQAKYRKEQEERNKKRCGKSSLNTNAYSGNIQLTISTEELKELENRINQYFEENGYFKRNLNDKDIKVFLNGKINLERDSLGNLGLVVPIKFDLKRMSLMELKGKVTKFNADFYFDVQLADSSTDKLIYLNIDSTHKLTKKPYYKLFSTFKLARIGTKTNEILEPELNKAVRCIQEKMDEVLLKDNIVNQINQNAPNGLTIKPGIVNIRPRVDSCNNQLFDIDLTADFQYRISTDDLKDAFPGYAGAGCCIDKIRNVEIVDGRVKVEVPASGAINGNINIEVTNTSAKVEIPIPGANTGSIIGKCDLLFCPDKQRFLMDNLEVTTQNNDSSLIDLSAKLCGVNCIRSYILDFVQYYTSNMLENSRLNAINYAEQHFRENLPGKLVIDADSISINSINYSNNVTVGFSLRANNS